MNPLTVSGEKCSTTAPLDFEEIYLLMQTVNNLVRLFKSLGLGFYAPSAELGVTASSGEMNSTHSLN